MRPIIASKLIKKCLDADPLKRPTAKNIKTTLDGWKKENNSRRSHQTELTKQIKEAENVNNDSLILTIPSTGLSYKTHSEAIYTSRLLSFKNLSKSKNSDDYYEQNDNIVSMKLSGN